MTGYWISPEGRVFTVAGSSLALEAFASRRLKHPQIEIHCSHELIKHGWIRINMEVGIITVHRLQDAQEVALRSFLVEYADGLPEKLEIDDWSSSHTKILSTRILSA